MGSVNRVNRVYRATTTQEEMYVTPSPIHVLIVQEVRMKIRFSTNARVVKRFGMSAKNFSRAVTIVFAKRLKI